VEHDSNSLKKGRSWREEERGLLASPEKFGTRPIKGIVGLDGKTKKVRKRYPH